VTYHRPMGRQSDARQRLLDATCTLIHTRSYGAVGVADICVEADVRKGSFYHFFDSKQALTLAAIDAHWAGQCEGWEATLRGSGPALGRLGDLFRETAASHRAEREAEGLVRGCVLANLALELSTQDQVVRGRLQEIFAEQIAMIEETLRAAAAEGEIPPESASRASARAVVAQMEGMILFAKLGNDPAVLDDLWAQTLLLLRASETPAFA
jgi:TetR/AcrR family transcriptional repressor of nem operon